MLVGQWRQDLVGLERKLQHELDQGPNIPVLGNRGKRVVGMSRSLSRLPEPRLDK